MPGQRTAPHPRSRWTSFRTRLRSQLLSWAVVVAALALFALGLHGSARGAIAITVVIAAVCVVIISRLSMSMIGVALVVAFALTASWDEVAVGGVKPRAFLLVLGLLLLVLGEGVRRPPRVPWWIHVYAAAVLFTTALQVAFPISETYIASRYLTSQAGKSLLTRPDVLSSVLSVLFNAYAVPIAVILACRALPRALGWIIWAIVAGVTLSCLAAFLGFEGNDVLLRPLVSLIPPAGVRALGYTSHPLHLATSAVFATGLACWLAVQRGLATKWLGRIAVPVLALGLYASGSRGGNAAGVLMIALCAVLLPSVRRRIHLVVAGLAVVLAGLVAVSPSLGLAVLRTTRLYDGTTNAISDQGRGQVFSQALSDFRQSPVFGIGIRYISEAHVLYAGTLASGGVILFAAYLAFNVGSLRDVVGSLASDRALGGALLATLIGSLAYWAVADEFSVASVQIVYGLIAVVTARARTGWTSRDAVTAETVPVALDGTGPAPVAP